MTSTKQRPAMSSPERETPSSLMHEGKKLLVVGQIALLGTSMAVAHEGLTQSIATGQQQHLGQAHLAEEARVLSHPDVVQAFEDSADAIHAWENSL